MKLWNQGRALRPAVTAVLCAGFFLLAMGVVLLGSTVYRAVTDAAAAHDAQRTALSYLVNQVRRADTAGGVALGSFGDGDALYLHEGDYVTILYCDGGQLRELYQEEGLSLAPADGTALLPLSALTLEGSGGVLSIAAQGPDGAVSCAEVAPRCGLNEEGAS